MRKSLLRTLIAGSALILVLSFVPAAVFAHDGEEGDDSTQTSNTEQESEDENDQEDQDNNDSVDELKNSLKELKQQRLENKQHRLAANKLRVCEARKARITAIINRSITRAERQLALFTTIAERVEAFYVQKGYSVANYDELVSAVSAAKADAEANLETLKSLDTFDCESDDPKGDIEAFKLTLKSVRQDLKDYRTSVKNLIVGVKSAQSNGSDSEEGGDE